MQLLRQVTRSFGRSEMKETLIEAKTELAIDAFLHRGLTMENVQACKIICCAYDRNSNTMGQTSAN
jgi:hypothetical protein